MYLFTVTLCLAAMRQILLAACFQACTRLAVMQRLAILTCG